MEAMERGEEPPREPPACRSRWDALGSLRSTSYNGLIAGCRMLTLRGAEMMQSFRIHFASARFAACARRRVLFARLPARGLY